MDLANLANLFARYLHIVCATLLIGGTLFYEMVVPVAIADLKPEQQLAIFGRARWVFRQIVWGSALIIVLTGILSATRHWQTYRSTELLVERANPDGTVEYADPPMVTARPGWWMAAHASAGMISVLIAVALTVGASPPGHPIQWMRLNLVILMIVIFVGSVTRHVRLNLEESGGNLLSVNVMSPVLNTFPDDDDSPATQPASQPTP